MRLTAEQAEIIRHTARKHFGPDARIWLFGSRTDDAARGGDIDLLIESRTKMPNPFMASVHLEVDLQNALDDQKIDIVISEPGKEETPIHRIARNTGIEL